MNLKDLRIIRKKLFFLNHKQKNNQYFDDYVGGVCNLVISVDCSLNYSHHKYNTKHYNRAKEME